MTETRWRASRPRRAATLLAATALLAGVLGGCSGDDEPDSGGGDTPAAATTTAEEPETTAEEPELAREAEGDSSPREDIPDADEDGLSDTIELEETEGGIEAIEVEVEITHDIPTELVVTLEGPSGATATLSDGESDTDDDLSLRLDENDRELRELLAEDASGDWELTVEDTVAADEGTLDSWSIRVETSPDAEAPEPLQEADGESSPNLAIPDDGEAVSDTIELDETDGEIVEIDFQASITHPFVGDLVVILTGPSGVDVTLADREGLGSDDLVLDLNENDRELRDLVGEEASGEWELSISDQSASDVGTLDDWSLSVTTE